MNTTESPNESLDCIGLFCPEPLFQTREAMGTDLLKARFSRCSRTTQPRKKTSPGLPNAPATRSRLSEDRGDHKRFLIRKRN
jgi:hypothetical protein